MNDDNFFRGLLVAAAITAPVWALVLWWIFG